MKHQLFFLFFAMSLMAYSQSSEKNLNDQNYIEVVGKAELEVEPDLIYLKIAISDKDIKSQQNLEDLEGLIKTKLTEIGVDITKDFYVKDFVSNFKSYFLSKTEVVLKKDYQLIVHDAKTLQKVFLELQKMDISNVSIQMVDNSKMDQYHKEVKSNAIKAAKAKAIYLTSSIDQSIGRAFFIQELVVDVESIDAQLRNRIPGLSINFKSSTSDTVMEFEKIKLNSSILVRFEIK
jgi:uncharacterized protein